MARWVAMARDWPELSPRRTLRRVAWSALVKLIRSGSISPWSAALWMSAWMA
jgi:hypothetical protein